MHTSLYALPPYSQALRASIAGTKWFSEPKSLCRLKLRRQYPPANRPPAVGDSHPGSIRRKGIRATGLQTAARNWFGHLTKANQAI